MTDKKPSTLEVLASRIAELETANKKLEEFAPFRHPTEDGPVDPFAVAQAKIVARKNANPDLVQVTAKGNVRTTLDPSDEFVREQDAAAKYGDDVGSPPLNERTTKA